MVDDALEPGPFAGLVSAAPADTFPRPRFSDDVAPVSAAMLQAHRAIDAARGAAGALDPGAFDSDTDAALRAVEGELDTLTTLADSITDLQLYRNAEVVRADLEQFQEALPNPNKSAPPPPLDEIPIGPEDDAPPAPPPAPPPEV